MAAGHATGGPSASAPVSAASQPPRKPAIVWRRRPWPLDGLRRTNAGDGANRPDRNQHHGAERQGGVEGERDADTAAFEDAAHPLAMDGSYLNEEKHPLVRVRVEGGATFEKAAETMAEWYGRWLKEDAGLLLPSER